MRFYLFFTLLFLFQLNLSAQWQQSQDSLLDGILPQTFTKYGTSLVMSDEKNVYLIDKNGMTSTLNLSGLPFNKRMITSLGSIGDTLFVYNYFGESYSTLDTGTNWTLLTTSGLPQGKFEPYPQILSFEHLLLYLDVNDAFYSANGSNWNYLCPNNELEVYSHKEFGINPFGNDSTFIYNSNVQIVDTLYNHPASMDIELQYEYTFNPYDSTIYQNEISVPGSLPIAIGQLNENPLVWDNGFSYLILGRMHLITAIYYSPTGNNMLKFYHSSDNGQTWNYRSDFTWMGYAYTPFYLSEDTLLAFDEQNAGFRITYDAGENWSKVDHQIKGLYYEGMESSEFLDTLFWIHAPNASASLSRGIFRSDDGGITWNAQNNGIPINYSSLDSAKQTYSIYNITRSGNDYYCIVNDFILYQSSDAGLNWQPSNLGSLSFQTIIGSDKTHLYISAVNPSSGKLEFFQTNDHGNSWQNINTPIGDTTGYNEVARHQIISKNDTLILRFNQFYYQSPFDHYKLYQSTDNAQTWTDITPVSVNNSANVRLGAYDNMGRGITGMSFGEHANTFIQIIEHRDTSIVEEYLFPSLINDSLYLFKNNVWTALNTNGLPTGVDMQAVSYSNYRWYLTTNMGVFESFDDGISWMASRSTIIEGLNGFNLQTNNGKLICATRGYGIWMKDIWLGINENDLTETIQLYPNPAHDFIIISGNDREAIEISDLSGKVCFTGIIQGESRTDISQLTSGFYLARIKSSNKTVKFIKN